MNGVLQASRITVGYTLVYSAAMLNQVVTKNLLIAKRSGSKTTFDRYQSMEMRDADRLLGNMIEWTPIFLGPLWALAMTRGNKSAAGYSTHDSDNNITSSHVIVAWMYVGLRLLYVILVKKYGVAGNGRNKRLWIATFPSYLCLSYLLVQSVWKVLL